MMPPINCAIGYKASLETKVVYLLICHNITRLLHSLVVKTINKVRKMADRQLVRKNASYLYLGDKTMCPDIIMSFLFITYGLANYWCRLRNLIRTQAK